MKKELEKIYQSYFPFNHGKHSDECGKKFSEVQMQKDFVDEIGAIFTRELWENFESQGDNFNDQEWNKNLQEIIDWINEDLKEP